MNAPEGWLVCATGVVCTAPGDGSSRLGRDSRRCGAVCSGRGQRLASELGWALAGLSLADDAYFCGLRSHRVRAGQWWLAVARGGSPRLGVVLVDESP